MCVIFHIPTYHGSSFIAIKLKSEYRFLTVASLFYIIRKWNYQNYIFLKIHYKVISKGFIQSPWRCCHVRNSHCRYFGITWELEVKEKLQGGLTSGGMKVVMCQMTIRQHSCMIILGLSVYKVWELIISKKKSCKFSHVWNCYCTWR
jgi:hypothetical protein